MMVKCLSAHIPPRSTSIRNCTHTQKLRPARPTAAFLPTGMSQLVENLTQAFPRRHHLLFADFDSLPPPTLEEGEKEDPRRKGVCAGGV